MGFCAALRPTRFAGASARRGGQGALQGVLSEPRFARSSGSRPLPSLPAGRQVGHLESLRDTKLKMPPRASSRTPWGASEDEAPAKILAGDLSGSKKP